MRACSLPSIDAAEPHARSHSTILRLHLSKATVNISYNREKNSHPPPDHDESGRGILSPTRGKGQSIAAVSAGAGVSTGEPTRRKLAAPRDRFWLREADKALLIIADNRQRGEKNRGAGRWLLAAAVATCGLPKKNIYIVAETVNRPFLNGTTEQLGRRYQTFVGTMLVVVLRATIRRCSPKRRSARRSDRQVHISTQLFADRGCQQCPTTTTTIISCHRHVRMLPKPLLIPQQYILL